MSEMTPEAQKAFNKSQLAKNIIEDPLVLEALASMERDIYDAWKVPNLTTEQMLELKRLNDTLSRFIGFFDLYLQNGAEGRYILGMAAEPKSFSQRVKEFFNHGNQ